MQTLYLAGKMTGEPEMGFPLFNATAAKLRSEGFNVINPAETDGGSTDKSWNYYMRKDIAQMMQCDAVVALHNWKDSKGAKIEIQLAHDLGIPVITPEFRAIPPPDKTPDPGLSKREETICQEADRLVSCDRQDSYGHPAEDFARTGRMWGAILGISDVPPEKVGLCMVALKISREVNKPKRDNRTDGAGYWKCVDMIQERKQSHK